MTAQARTKQQPLNIVDSLESPQDYLSYNKRGQATVRGLEKTRQHRNVLKDNSQVLVITSDASLARLIQLNLERDSYRVSLSFDGVSGFAAVKDKYPDLIVVDWALSGLAATEFCHYLRSNSYQTPLIMLTEVEQVGDRIASLNSGADDCLEKPFQMDELRAKIRAHFRRLGNDIGDVLRFADLVMDIRAREVRRHGTHIYFTAREFDLLEYLMRHPNQVLSRSQILSQVWGNDFEGESNVVEVYIRNLRQKLEQPQSKRVIQTMRGVGYVLREQ